MFVKHDLYVYTFRYFRYIGVNGHVRCELNINLVTNIAFLTTYMNGILSEDIYYVWYTELYTFVTTRY